ncbi:O-antigen ligase family protein [Methylobacterium sp. A49B]
MREHAPASSVVVDGAAVFLLGAALQFNVLTSSFGLPFQRLSDLLPFLLIPWFGLRRAVVAEALHNIAPIMGIVALIAISLVLKAHTLAGDVYLTLVLLLYIVQGFILLVLFRDRRLENAFCMGLLAGLLGSVAVLLLASTGASLERFGLAVPTDGVDEELRLFFQDKLGGLWVSGNETGHVFAVAGAAALLLSLRYRMKAIYLVYVAALLTSFPLTNNRAGLFMPLLCLAVLMRRNMRAPVVLSVLGILSVLAIAWSLTGDIPLPGTLAQALERRFAADTNLSGNVDERFLSGVSALQLVAAYPFGVGEIARREELQALTGLVTPHNGFVSLALQSGLATLLLLVAGLIRILTAPAAAGPLLTYTALFLIPSLMFEELSVNQYVLFFMALVVASLAIPLDHAARQSGPADRIPV